MHCTMANRTVAFLCLLVVIVMTVGAPSAAGQVALPVDDFTRELQADFLRRDMALINDRVNPGADQRAIIEAVLQDYLLSFDESARVARDELDAIRPAREVFGQQIQAQQEQLQMEMEVLVQRLSDAMDSDAPPEQIEALTAQLRDRIAAVKSEIDSLAAQMSEARGAGMEQLAAALRDALHRWRQRKASLREAFVSDVRLILNEDQHAAFDGALTEIRRQRLLPAGELAGEKLDLFNVLRQTGLDATLGEPGSAILSEYAAALDTSLQNREQVIDDATVPHWLAVRTGDQDEAATQREIVVNARLAVRDLHLRTAQRLAEPLDAEQAAALHLAVRRQAFAGLATPSIASRLLAEAAESPDRSPEQVEAILLRLAEHEQHWDQLQAQLEQVTLERQPIALVARHGRAEGRGESAAAEQAMTNARAALVQLDLQTIDFVRSTVGEDAFAQLASAPAAMSLIRSMEEARRSSGMRPSERRELLNRLNLGGGG